MTDDFLLFLLLSAKKRPAKGKLFLNKPAFRWILGLTPLRYTSFFFHILEDCEIFHTFAVSFEILG